MYKKFNLGIGLDKNARIAESLTELTGNTPMVKVSGYAALHGIKAEIVAKLEYFNPLGSAKDRVGIALIDAAEKGGIIKEGAVIIEPTSGNTGVGLALACAVRGYKLMLTMPENMSRERVLLLKALGAEIVLTDAKKGMAGAIERAQEIKDSTENSYIPDQFNNPANADIHRKTTGPEILRDTYGKIDYFIAGVGTGGTITGVGEVLKAFNPDIRVIAVEPSGSPVLSGGEKGAHGLMGIGAGFIPSILNRSIIDEVITVTEEQAYTAAREAARTDGLLVGISSGAVLHAAREIAQRSNNKDLRIVVLLPDSGERYLSTELFNY